MYRLDQKMLWQVPEKHSASKQNDKPVESRDYMDKNLPLQERIKRFSGQVSLSSPSRKSSDGETLKAVCPYCLGGGFLLVDYSWVMDERIPGEMGQYASHYVNFDRVRGNVAMSKAHQVHVPCDCHPGKLSKYQKGAETIHDDIKCFKDIFKREISSHWWGEELLKARQNRDKGQMSVHEHSAKDAVDSVVIDVQAEMIDEVPF